MYYKARVRDRVRAQSTRPRGRECPANIHQLPVDAQELRDLTADRRLGLDHQVVRVHPDPRRRVGDRRRRGAEALGRACGAAPGGPQRADVPHHERRVAVVGEAVDARYAEVGLAVRVAPGVHRRETDVGADGARLDLRGQVGHLVVPEREQLEHLVRRRVRRRVVRHVPRVPVGLAPVPEDLDQREQQRPLQLVRVGGIQNRRVHVEVHAAREQQAVVHRAHVEDGAIQVRGHGREPAARYPALAVSVVEEAPRVDQRPAVPLEGGVGGEAAGVDQRPPDEQEVEEALLEAVGQAREPGQVLQDAHGVRHVVLRHADEVRAAHEDVVLVAQLLDVVGPHLAGVAEEAMAVEGRAGRSVRGGRARDVADERGLVGVAREALREAVGTELVARARRAAGLIQEAGHGHVALHAAGHVRLLRGRVVDHPVDRVLRRHALHAEVLQVAVAELREGAVADGQHPLRQRALAGHGEVPRQIEIPAVDARPPKRPEDRLHVPAPLLEGPGVGPHPVSVEPERAPGLELLAVGAAQLPQRHDVALAFAEVLAGADGQRRAGRRGGVRVELRPDQLPVPGAGVDDHDRRLRVIGPCQVGDRYSARAGDGGRSVKAGDLQHDGLARAEAVRAVVVRRLDGHARTVARHHRGLEVELAPRAGVRRPREVVVGPREETGRAAERVAAGRHHGRGHDVAGVRRCGGRHAQAGHQQRDCRHSPPHGAASLTHRASAVSYLRRKALMRSA